MQNMNELYISNNYQPTKTFTAVGKTKAANKCINNLRIKKEGSPPCKILCQSINN